MGDLVQVIISVMIIDTDTINDVRCENTCGDKSNTVYAEIDTVISLSIYMSYTTTYEEVQHWTDIEVDLVSRHRDADVCHLANVRISVKTTDSSRAYLGAKLSAYASLQSLT